MSEDAHVVVLGAGVCGLYAARVLAEAGVRVTVVERDPVVGGLAAGHERNGNYYDLGVHQLHAFDRALFDDVHHLMGDQLIPSDKLAMIRYGDGYRRYPLEFMDLLSGIPPWTLITAVTGLVVQSLRNRVSRDAPGNAEEALVQLYGRPLYEHFFRDFTHRYWGIPPSGLSSSFVRTKMPRLSAVDVLKDVFERFGFGTPGDTAVESALTHETLYYARTGSRELPLALADYVSAHGGEVLLESAATGVLAEEGHVKSIRVAGPDGARDIGCDAVVSTIPLPDLVRAFDPPAPGEALDACNRLKYRALAVYGLLVRQPRALDAQFIYYRERVFHRVAEPKNSGMRIEPSDHTIVLVETTCHVGDDRWEGGEATRRRVVADLEAEGLLIESDIAEMHLLRAEHGYPVFELGFEPHRDRCMAFLARFPNIRSTGREGAFAYPNMHDAMRMGATAAQELVADLLPGERAAGGHMTMGVRP